MAEARARRLFLALWPNSEERQRIAALTRSLEGGRKVIAENLHLTLVFLGASDSERLRCYESALQGLRVPFMELRLDRLGYWPKPRILWLGSGQATPVLAELVGILNQRLSRCGHKPENRPFTPHVTLIRKHPGSLSNVDVSPPIHWSTRRFALVESRTDNTGTYYQVVSYWPED
ncbi:MAG: RNA 2',3'-cyclic phosphodiesterase [Gammaproteobacteria bacterium]|nr:RNA 2',3'-cyclic phosphodiesterase [Gammaproteobacteria bacterium]MCP5424810.1 RNA 2',3'-cyclic phosphodiesterase [Gammaproteobacteria bacterium]MCP5458213.1 RNA 2',3'-cyclic phosphodiesterase [Gammaproteobacteria bacterium]